MTHPRDMGAKQVESFLTMLATERKVSASTHNQALSALLFLYREVLEIDLPWLTDINRPTRTPRIPSVLTKDEVAGLLAVMDGETALLARLLYGTGMRLMEGMRLRVKDVEFDRHVIIVREAKGNKDRVVMLPRSLAPALRLQMLAARASWEADRQAQRAGVEVPDALGSEIPEAGADLGMVLDVSVAHLVHRPAQRHRAATSFVRRTITARFEKSGSAGGDCEAGIGSHLAAQFCYPSVAVGNRHSHRAGAAGPQ